MQKKLISAIALVLASGAGSAGAQTSVSADVTANTTWGGAANPCPIILESPIFVKSGATLTILPGCIVRGQPRTDAVTPGSTIGTPGALIVTQIGRVVADASATNPIIMTTAVVDNDDDGIPDDVKDINGDPAPGGDGFFDKWVPGDLFLDDTPTTAPLAPLNKAGTPNVSLWGGLVVLGNAPTNLGTGCGVGLGRCTVEGLTIPGFDPADATFGGLETHDSSGSLRFVSVRHAGDEIGNSNELNGVTLGGVGDGTVFQNIEVYANFDDGIEWFGGTVNGKNLVVVFAGDDNFDLDQGYTGVNQFLFGIMPFFNDNFGGAFGSASGDKGGEWDGDDFVEVGGANVQADGTCRPFSYPQMHNVTIIGSTPDAGQDFVPISAASANRGIQMRSGFAGELLNSIIVNTGAAQGFDVDVAATGCPGQQTWPDNVGACTAQVLASTLDDGAALPAEELAALACGNADVRTAAAGSDNVVNAAGFPNLVREDTTFDPTGNAAGKLVAGLKVAPINPKPNFGLTGIAGGVNTGPTPATFRGAFDRSKPGLWTDGWTVLSIAGLLVGP
jgi:hypothetical protein